jgi:hypothetical protein
MQTTLTITPVVRAAAPTWSGEADPSIHEH